MNKKAAMIMKISEAYRFVYDGISYAAGYASMAGLLNGLATDDSFKDVFGEGYINHFIASMFVSSLYNPIFSKLKHTKQYRLYANLSQLGLAVMMTTWHYTIGTENPLEVMIPMNMIAFPMINRHVSRDLDEIV